MTGGPGGCIIPPAGPSALCRAGRGTRGGAAMGKALTAASAAFVREAEEALFWVPVPLVFLKLRARIDRVRDGLDVLREPVADMDAYIECL